MDFVSGGIGQKNLTPIPQGQTQVVDEEQRAVDTFKRVMEEMNAIKLQLDNTPMLKNEKCRCMGGYYDEDNFFNYDITRKPLMNCDGWNKFESYLDNNTNINTVTSILKTKDIFKFGRIEALTFAIDIFKNYKAYGISLDNIQSLIISAVVISFKGLMRGEEGKTLKTVNKIIKQIEQILKNDGEEKKKGWFGR